MSASSSGLASGKKPFQRKSTQLPPRALLGFAQVSLRPLPVAFLDLEDVAFGVAEIAPAAASPSVPFNPGDLLHAATDKLAARGFNVGGRIPNLAACLVVLRLAAALDELEYTRFAEIELDPARAGGQFGQPSTSR